LHGVKTGSVKGQTDSLNVTGESGDTVWERQLQPLEVSQQW